MKYSCTAMASDRVDDGHTTPTTLGSIETFLFRAKIPGEVLNE